ncbi:Hypp8196 [Branchiostoma lanceolatum]|uniref:Hypp8196 protein n=1 Tax=Branchiostoma lanceolatum TaxID=7740 RepID=A0A8J9Z6F6_BRALA|nr:Hypp8196 [Branchiostoma lanceolatum]
MVFIFCTLQTSQSLTSASHIHLVHLTAKTTPRRNCPLKMPMSLDILRGNLKVLVHLDVLQVPLEELVPLEVVTKFHDEWHEKMDVTQEELEKVQDKLSLPTPIAVETDQIEEQISEDEAGPEEGC